MERQTEMTFTEIQVLLNNEKKSNYPRCLLLNELGCLCLDGLDSDDEGIKLFTRLLESESDNEKYISYIFLQIIPGASDKAKEELDKFKAEKANANIILKAQAHAIKENF